MIANDKKKQRETEQMIQLYREGKGLEAIGRLMNCSLGTVQYRLKKAGEPRRGKGRPRTVKPRANVSPPPRAERTRAKIERARQLKAEGWKQSCIATEIGLSQGRISQMLKEAESWPAPKESPATEQPATDPATATAPLAVAQ